MPTIGEQTDIATESGEPIEGEVDEPIFRKNGGDQIISEMSDDELKEAVDEVNGRMEHHRDRIYSRYTSINTLMGVRNNLTVELQERGVDLMIPQVQTIEEA